MPKKQKQSARWKLFIQFVKVNLAGNVLFWATYLTFPLFHEVMGLSSLQALIYASLIGNTLFFIIDKEWIFVDKTGRRKTSTEVTRFMIFMTLNFFINLAIVEGLNRYANITPYIGQFISAVFFSVWNFIGLKFWVFEETHHHAITLHTTKKVHRVRRA